MSRTILDFQIKAYLKLVSSIYNEVDPRKSVHNHRNMSLTLFLTEQADYFAFSSLFKICLGMIFSGWVGEVRNGQTVLINHTQGKSCPHGSNRSRSSNRLLTSLEYKDIGYCNSC